MPPELRDSSLEYSEGQGLRHSSTPRFCPRFLSVSDSERYACWLGSTYPLLRSGRLSHRNLAVCSKFHLPLLTSISAHKPSCNSSNQETGGNFY